MRGLTLLVFASCAFCAPDPRRLPMSFEPNLGQAPAKVRYLARGRGYILAAETTALRFRTPAGSLYMRFAGAHPTAVIQPEGILPGKMNYLRTNDRSRWHTDIPTYSRIRYRNLYSGIDLLCHGNQGDLEYDFVLAPGARASDILLDFPGIDRLRIAANGDLVLESDGRRVVHRAPVIYQEIDGAPRAVAGHYVRRGARSAGFALGPYDRARPLVIDPTLVYATYVAAYGYADQANGMAIDANGNAYIVGSTLKDQYGDQDIFVFEIDPTGTKQVNAAAFGGTYDNVGNAIAVDSAGNVYIAGATQSPDAPVAGTIFQQHIHGGENAYLAVIKPDFKSLVFATFLGGSNADEAFAIALDASRNVFVAGGTTSTDFPNSSSSYQRRLGGGIDGFLAKFSATGAAQYSTYFGGSGNEIAYGLATDASGNVYITGSTTSTNLPTTGGVYQNSNAGSTDAFVAKFSNGGSLIYSTYFGGSDVDSAQAIAVDPAGNAYITGTTASTNLPTTTTGFQPGAGGGKDAFIAKLNPSGATLAWSTYLGGSGDENANAIAVDSAGSVYVTGSTDSSNFPLTSDASQSSVGLASVAFVSELSSDGGSLIYSTLFGGSSGDAGTSIAVSCTTGVYITGATQSTDFPVSNGAQLGKATGQENGFLVRFAGASGPPAINPNGVVNGANLAPGTVAPGSLIVIQGSNLAGPTMNAPGVPLPLTLGGASVTVNGVNAPLSSVSPGQINAQLPWETQPGTAQVVVNGCGSTASMQVTVGDSAPAIFQDSSGHAVVRNQDGSTNDASHPAPAGSVVTVSLTGIGPVTNQPATGSPAPTGGPPSTATLGAAASIGEQPAALQFVGITPGSVAVDEAMVTVPALSSGDYPLIISIGNVASNPAMISVAGQ